jgi:hypothetical protein
MQLWTLSQLHWRAQLGLVHAVRYTCPNGYNKWPALDAHATDQAKLKIGAADVNSQSAKDISHLPH